MNGKDIRTLSVTTGNISSTLAFSSLKENDSGMYVCMANISSPSKNIHSSSSASTDISLTRKCTPCWPVVLIFLCCIIIQHPLWYHSLEQMLIHKPGK